MNNDLHIKTERLTYRGETRTGQEFDRLIVACADDGQLFYRFLFDEEGNHACWHPKAGTVSNFFGFEFTAATLDGEPCLVTIEKLKMR